MLKPMNIIMAVDDIRLAHQPLKEGYRRLDALDDVFRESLTEYTSLAKEADRCASDLKLMQDAWPK